MIDTVNIAIKKKLIKIIEHSWKKKYSNEMKNFILNRMITRHINDFH